MDNYVSIRSEILYSDGSRLTTFSAHYSKLHCKLLQRYFLLTVNG